MGKAETNYAILTAYFLISSFSNSKKYFFYFENKNISFSQLFGYAVNDIEER